MARDLEVADEPRRNRTATGLDASGLVEEQCALARARQLVRCSCACWSATYDDDIERLDRCAHGQCPSLVRAYCERADHHPYDKAAHAGHVVAGRALARCTHQLGHE